MTKTPKDKDIKLTFEQAMEEIEETVCLMEGNDLPLEQIIEKYEKGMSLIEYCSEKLKAAEKKIELLTRNSNGSVQSNQVSADQLSDDREEDKPSLF
jgi:exodeoxyribonuclease VII small subunit